MLLSRATACYYYMRVQILAIWKIKHLAHINFSDFRNYCSIVAVRGQLLASTVFSEKWAIR